MVQGQINLRDAIERTHRLHLARGQELQADRGRRHPRGPRRAAGTCRRSTCSSTASRSSGSLFDFGLYFFHNAQRLIAPGLGPYFYLPKMESHLEARLWNDVFVARAGRARDPAGHDPRDRADRDATRPPSRWTRSCYELREHSAGLNAGRWDYMFSVIKTFRTRGERLHAARPQLGDDDRAVHARLHRAAGAAPVTSAVRTRSAGWRPSSRARTRRSTRTRSRRSGTTRPGRPDDGFDGSWVAHPGLVAVCTEVFDAVLGDRPNQIDKHRARTSPSPPTSCSTSPRRRARSTECRAARQHQRGHPLPRVVAARLGCGRHPQPDGGRRHRRDLAVAGVAVAAQRRRPSTTARPSPATWSSG